jgi:glycogen debranching enzyme
MGSSSVPVEILRLNVTELFDAQKKTQSLRQVSRGCKLEFVAEAGSSDLLEQGLELWSNYPPSESTKFKREEYYKYPSSYDPLTVWRASIPCTFRAGFFQFYLQSSTSKSQIGTFNVEPIVRINKRVIHKEEIVLQTMLCKSMGSVPDRWQQLIHSAAQSGYNAIHVTPIQVLGQSHSSYSIADQQTLSPSLYPSSSMSPAEQLDHLKHFLLQMEEQEGVFFMTDVVWNHTANNSPWLVEHPGNNSLTPLHYVT